MRVAQAAPAGVSSVGSSIPSRCDAAQDGVDDAVAGARLGQLDGLGDRRVRRDAVEEQELEEPELQRGADAGLEARPSCARR